MTKLYYFANIRMPTEKAHGLQIMQNCEAFSETGVDVTLFVARRVNTPEMAQIEDAWAHYGVARSFSIRWIACVDAFPLLERFSARLAFATQSFTYTLVLLLRMLFQRGDVIYYSRDVLTMLALSVIKPRRRLAYEAHQLSQSGPGKAMQSACVRRVGTVIAVTEHLAEDLRKRGAKHVMVGRDGYRAERFANLPDRAGARKRLGFPAEAYIVGYVGRLHTMQMSKGVDTLVDAIAQSGQPLSLCLVGGPADMAEALRKRWIAAGLAPERFLFPGQAAPDEVPAYIAAFDVCTLPSPWTPFFAYQASPLKLFEYMAAGGVILASELPSVVEVLRADVTALMAAPGDVAAWAAALTRLYTDPALRERLGKTALAVAAQYTWKARAVAILAAIRQQGL